MSFLGESESASDTLGQITLGAGIVLNRRFSIVPAAVIPFGLAGAGTAF